MSESTNGNAGPSPHNSALRPLRKRPRTADPLVPRKVARMAASRRAEASKSAAARDTMTLEDIEATRRQNGGWSNPLPKGAQSFSLLSTKKSERDAARYHVMRLVRPGVDNERAVDVTDPVEFPRPVTLTRRDPRQPPPGRAFKDQTPENLFTDADKEYERSQRLKAEREVQKTQDQARIAPLLRDAGPRRPKNGKPNDKSSKFGNDYGSFKETKESLLRYEEALPWHVEDADNKNVWVGNYVSALSESNPAVANVAFVIDRPGFRVIPLEKWYRFTSKPPFTPYSIDQAEALMSKKADVGRWLMRDQEKKQTQEEWAATRSFVHGGSRIKTESLTFKGVSRQDRLEHDDVDVEGDDFQDDDENAGFDNDNEDEKDAKNRIRREQLGANTFGDADEAVVDKEEAEAVQEKENRRRLGKQVKQALIARERDTAYESDSSEDPFGKDSNDESSETEDDVEGEGKDGVEVEDKDKVAAGPAAAKAG